MRAFGRTASRDWVPWKYNKTKPRKLQGPPGRSQEGSPLTTGLLVGSAIPVPIVGPLVGVVVGAVAGTEVGRRLGKATFSAGTAFD